MCLTVESSNIGLVQPVATQISAPMSFYCQLSGAELWESNSKAWPHGVGLKPTLSDPFLSFASGSYRAPYLAGEYQKPVIPQSLPDNPA